MSKQTEALKLALEALSPWAGEDANHTEQYAAYHAIREALAEQETVLPGGGHVPAVPVAVYGYCPECGGAGVMRERRPNGDDKCTNGHKYPSSKALAEQPTQQVELADIIEGMSVSVDVSTSEADAGHRYFGTVTEVMEAPFDKHGLTLLVQDAKPNFDIQAQRKPWVGLTEDERHTITNKYQSKFVVSVMTEDKLREKNT